MFKPSEKRRHLLIEIRGSDVYAAQRKRVEEVVAQDGAAATYVPEPAGGVILLKNTTSHPGHFNAAGVNAIEVARDQISTLEAGIEGRSLKAENTDLKSRGDPDFYGPVQRTLQSFAYESGHTPPPERFNNVGELISYLENLTLEKIEGRERVEAEKNRDDLDARLAALEKQGKEAHVVYEQEKAGYERQLEELKRNVKELEKALEEAEEGKRAAEGNYHKIQQKGLELSLKERALEAQAARLSKGIPHANVEELRRRLETQGKTIRELGIGSERLKSEAVECNRRMGELVAQYAGLKRQYDSSHNKGLRQDYERARRQIEELEARMKERDQRIKELEAAQSSSDKEPVPATQLRKANAQPEQAPELEGRIDQYASAVHDGKVVPDPEAETTAELFGYLFDSRKSLVVDRVFAEHGVESHRATGRAGATRIYRFGAIDNGDSQLATIATQLHQEFGITHPVEASVSVVRRYFSEGNQNGYNPAEWEDSKVLTLREAALAARRSEKTLALAFHKHGIQPLSDDSGKRYLFGAVRDIVMDRFLQRPGEIKE